MREVTKLLINKYKIEELGYDFMGYSLQKNDIYTFHHLIIPKRDGGEYEEWNGVILCGLTSHPYLHLIESKDHTLFHYITLEMIDMKYKGYLDIVNLKRINEILKEFENEYSDKRTRKGKLLIKEEYKKRLIQ